VGSVCRVKRFTTGSRNVADDEEVETELRKWLRQQPNDFNAVDFDALVEMGQMYQCWCRICREINAFSQIRLSHVLRFVSICDLFTDFPSYTHNTTP
jgi:hypothetical protein